MRFLIRLAKWVAITLVLAFVVLGFAGLILGYFTALALPN